MDRRTMFSSSISRLHRAKRLSAAVVHARRARKYAHTRWLTFLLWKTVVSIDNTIRLCKGCGTRLCRIAQMPEDPAGDNRGQVHFGREAVAVLLIGQKIGGQGQPTPGQDRHETVLTEGADETVEGHGGDMIEDRTQLQTQATVGG